MEVTEEHRRAIAAVFDGIRLAAMLIESANPEAVLAAWERQETTMPFLDPTAYQKMLGARDDVRRKKEIIQAAAVFLREWNRIKAEALEASEVVPRPSRDTAPTPRGSR